MKITKKQLRQIINEEFRLLEADRDGDGKLGADELRSMAGDLEAGAPPDMDAEGWGPNDSEEWERQARFEQGEDAKVEKENFLAAQYSRWEDHWGIDDDIEAEVIISILQKAYEDIESEWGF